jgi:phytoene synthase
MEALWRLDVTFASVLATGTDRMIGRIRLAWWHEALERLDREAAPAEPLLQALQVHVLPSGIAGAALAAMEEGWAILLSEHVLTPEELVCYASARGGGLFRLSAQLLGDSDFRVEQAGALWALADLARHSANPEEANSAFEVAEPEVPVRWPRPLRPLGMLAALARRDFERSGASWERQGSPARMLRMIGHRLTGI